jgi:hypothetical protein
MSDIVEKSLAVTTDTTLERGRRRSERVALKVPLKLTARMPDGHRICIEVQIMLNNNRSGELVTASILRIEKTELGRFFAAFEFEYPVVEFWPVSFPPTKDPTWSD